MFGATAFLVLLTIAILVGGAGGYLKSLGKCKSKWMTVLYVLGGAISLVAEFGKSLAAGVILSIGLHVSWSILF